MKLQQTQAQILSQQQRSSLELLQLSAPELDAFIQELAQENPLVEPEEPSYAPPPEPSGESELLNRLRWLEDNDRQNRFYQQISDEELDPLAWVGTDGGLGETLLSFVTRQLEQRGLEGEMVRLVRYLTSCLDDDGYLRIPLEELTPGAGVPAQRLAQALAVLRTLEPAGIGAGDLSQCLALQLERIGEDGPAMDIVLHHLDLLARRRERAIAEQLNISLEEVREAQRTIRELEPRPGAVFQRAEQVPYLHPDVAVEESGDGFTVRSLRGERPPFHINGYYRTLLAQTGDPQVKEYLSGKLEQAQAVLQAAQRRESTLLRCTQAILAHQEAFFRQGPEALLPLRMGDVARELELHESTVSRAVREKYLQCSQGTFPLSYFFSRPAAAEAGSPGGEAARALLRRLIGEEDKTRPLSDQQLCRRMAQEGCPVSRRTAAKYREELQIPPASARKVRT